MKSDEFSDGRLHHAPKRPAAARLAVCQLMIIGLALCKAPDLSHGLESFNAGQFDRALAEFEAARRLQPGNANIENVIGVTLTKLGRTAEANTHYRKAIQLNPKLQSAYKNLGFNLLQQNEHKAAERELKVALALAPEDVFTHYYLGLIYLSTEREAEAVSHLQKAGTILTNDFDTSLRYANACFHLGMKEPALASLSALGRRQDLTVPQRFQLAQFLTSRNQHNDAVEQFRRLADEEPQRWEHKYNLGIALLNAQRPKEAVALIKAVEAQHPQNADLHSLLGFAYEAAQDLPQALRSYEEALKADPNNPDRYLDYTRLLMDLDRFDESARLVQEGMRAVQDSYALYLRFGAVKSFEGRQEEAREAFQKAIHAHPEISLGYVALARSYIRDGQEAEAVKVLEGARGKLRPDFMVEYFYGLALSRLGRDEGACEAFARAVSLNSGVPEVHYELGKTLAKLQQFDAAMRELHKAVQLDPQHSGAHYQLSRVYSQLGEMEKAHEFAERTKELRRADLENRRKVQRARLESFGSLSPPQK